MKPLRLGCLAIAVLAGWTAPVNAQVKRPTPTVTAEAVPGGVSPGSSARLRLKIVLPPGLHVQSDKPRDPSLVQTKLSLTPPSGVSIGRTTYPKPMDLAQPGGSEPLSVFSGTFTIEVPIGIGKPMQAGTITIPGELRYQSCTDQVCFPPSRALLSWRVTVTSR
jgi:DsbC/DsbD-like thiol-disulfide interchange protein